MSILKILVVLFFVSFLAYVFYLFIVLFYMGVSNLNFMPAGYLFAMPKVFFFKENKGFEKEILFQICLLHTIWCSIMIHIDLASISIDESS